MLVAFVMCLPSRLFLRPNRRRGLLNNNFLNIKLCFIDVNHNCGERAGFFWALFGLTTDLCIVVGLLWRLSLPISPHGAYPSFGRILTANSGPMIPVAVTRRAS